MKEDNKDFGVKILIFCFIGCVYYLIRKDSGDYYINKGIMEVLVIGCLILFSQTVMWVSRYYMPQVTVNGHTGSILGRPIVVKSSGVSRPGDSSTIQKQYSVFNTGESLEPFHIRGKLSTLVVPKEQIHRSGQNYIGRVFVRKVQYESLPPEVYSYLQHHSGDFNTEVIYYGEYSEEYTFNNPDTIDYQAQITKLNSQINIRNDIIEGRNDLLVEMKKMAEEVSGSNKKWYEVLRRPEQRREDE